MTSFYDWASLKRKGCLNCLHYASSQSIMWCLNRWKMVYIDLSAGSFHHLGRKLFQRKHHHFPPAYFSWLLLDPKSLWIMPSSLHQKRRIWCLLSYQSPMQDWISNQYFLCLFETSEADPWKLCIFDRHPLSFPSPS